MHEDANKVLKKTQWVKKADEIEVILSSKLSAAAKPQLVMRDADASGSDVIIWMCETDWVGHVMAIGLFYCSCVLAS